MIAYNTTELHHLLVQSNVTGWEEEGLITEEEKRSVLDKYPVKLFMPQFFLRLGLGILTVIASSAAAGILFIANDARVPEALFIICGIGSIAALEMFIKKKHYRSGVDDVLLHLGILYLFTGTMMMLADDVNDNAELLVFSITAIILYGIAALRYLDRLAALFFVAAIVVFEYALYMNTVGKPSVPLLLMNASIMATLIFFCRKLAGKQIARFHGDLLRLMELTGIICLYMSFHYLLVAGLFELQPITGNRADLAPLSQTWFYWAWTIIFPLGLLWYSNRKVNRDYLRLSVLLILSIFYVKHLIYPSMAPEWAALLYGLLLIAVSYFVIRYLRKDKSKFTYDVKADGTGMNQVEQLAVTAAFSGIGLSSTEKGTQFQGGNFGGGGAGSDY
jgi:hypothetical protein